MGLIGCSAWSYNGHGISNHFKRLGAPFGVNTVPSNVPIYQDDNNSIHSANHIQEVLWLIGWSQIYHGLPGLSLIEPLSSGVKIKVHSEVHFPRIHASKNCRPLEESNIPLHTVQNLHDSILSCSEEEGWPNPYELWDSCFHYFVLPLCLPVHTSSCIHIMVLSGGSFWRV